MPEGIVHPGCGHRGVVPSAAEHQAARQGLRSINLRCRVDRESPEATPPLFDGRTNVEAHFTELAKAGCEILLEPKALAVEIEERLVVGVHRGTCQISVQRSSAAQLRGIEGLLDQGRESAQIRRDLRYRRHRPIGIVEARSRSLPYDAVGLPAEK